MFLVTACSQAKFAVVNLPILFSDVEIAKDIQFSDTDETLGLDVYSPQNIDNAPVLVFFYGGGWKDGSKDDYKFIGDYFSKKGFVVVIPDYRKYPNVKFPTFVHDAADAVRWTQANISSYRGDAANISVMGHSAGAHIGALLVSDPEYLKDYTDISAFVGLAGPYNFEPEEPDYKAIFGPPSNYPNMQVTSFIDGSEPPMLLMYGLKDETVHIRNLNTLVDQLEKHNNAYTKKIYQDLDHVGMVSNLTWVFKHKSSIGNDITAFLKKRL